MTVQEIIDGMIEKTGVTPLPYDKTCDHIMCGSKDMEVTKIVTTFMATVEVIREAIRFGANLIITHEPTWFTGLDETEWLSEDPIYLKKRKLLEENGITLYRFHDHMHMDAEDGIYRGFDLEMGWKQYRIENAPGMEHFGCCYQIPKIKLRELSDFFKEKLAMEVIQIVGNKEMEVERVGVLVGGGSLGLGIEELPMQLMDKNNLDLVVCGDITEWTISAYVNDATALGFNKGMLVLGHERSEEMGMKHLVPWLKDIIGEIPVKFIDAKEPFQYL